MSDLILASCSPRRSELLRRFGVSFQTCAPDVDESCDLSAADAVMELSRRKASAVAAVRADAFILAADTLVSFRGRSLGKPADGANALRMLEMLSGSTHQVFTGVTVISPGGRILTDFDRSDVTFCTVPKAELLAYVRSGEPMDKAGSYGIQGHAGLWVTRLEGSYSSVIGLPLYLVRRLLLEAGFPLFEPQNASLL